MSLHDAHGLLLARVAQDSVVGYLHIPLLVALLNLLANFLAAASVHGVDAKALLRGGQQGCLSGAAAAAAAAAAVH